MDRVKPGNTVPPQLRQSPTAPRLELAAPPNTRRPGQSNGEQGQAPTVHQRPGEVTKEWLNPKTFKDEFPRKVRYGRALMAHMPFMPNARQKSLDLNERLKLIEVTREKEGHHLREDYKSSIRRGTTERKRLKHNDVGILTAVAAAAGLVYLAVHTVSGAISAETPRSARTTPNSTPAASAAAAKTTTPGTVSSTEGGFTVTATNPNSPSTTISFDLSPTVAATAPAATEAVTQAAVTEAATVAKTPNSAAFTLQYIGGITLDCSGLAPVKLAAKESPNTAFYSVNPGILNSAAPTTEQKDWVGTHMDDVFKGHLSNPDDPSSALLPHYLDAPKAVELTVSGCVLA